MAHIKIEDDRLLLLISTLTEMYNQFSDVRLFILNGFPKRSTMTKNCLKLDDMLINVKEGLIDEQHARHKRKGSL